MANRFSNPGASGLLRPAIAGLGLLLAAMPLGAQLAPVPPPVEQLTADCRNPVYATDQLVCGDPALRSLDSALAEALAGFSEPTSRWFEPQREWFKRRSRCAFAKDHSACAAAAYRDRLTLLRPVNPEAARVPVRCNDPAVSAVAVSANQTALLSDAGRVIGVAPSDMADEPWQPFLRLSKRAKRLTLRTIQGDTLDCRIGRRD